MVPHKQALGVRVPLSRYTTLGVGGEAALWEVNDEADLKEATLEPYRVLGAGSNLLVSDAGVHERVIKLGSAFNAVRRFSGATELWLGAATPVPGLVRRAGDLGLSGLEGMLGIPAVLGGAVKMNAGTRYGCMADTLQEVEVFVNGALERLPANALGLSYRSSNLPKGAIVTRVRLKLTPSTPERVRERMALVDAARKGQPKVKSAGCAFKNPEGDSAGRLIDAAGLKGLRVGNVMVSYEHANFVVNLGGASAKDVVTLLGMIRERLPQLELEWERWGFEHEGFKHEALEALR